MNKIIRIIGITAAMLLSFFPASAYDFEVDGIYYSIVSLPDLTCKVVQGEDKYSGDVTIPTEVVYNNRTITVVEIGSSAFSNCTSLTSVKIPESVTVIGNKAFYKCSLLVSVTIPNSVTKIDNETFYGCSALTSVIIPDSVTEIGSHAFSRCSSLTSVTIPDSVTEINDHTFYGCSSLTSVIIPDSVIKIGDYAFEYCRYLTSVIIPDSVTKIGAHAFANCTHSLTSLIIPDSVTEIGSYAFSECKSLTSVTISGSLTKIKYKTFYMCKSLTSVTIPDSVTEIEDDAFYGCLALTSVKISGPIEKIDVDAFGECRALENVYLGEGLTTIGYSWFNNLSIKSISIAGSVNSIYTIKGYNYIDYPGTYYSYNKGGVFFGCDNLNEIIFEYGQNPIHFYKDNSYVSYYPTIDELVKQQGMFAYIDIGSTGPIYSYFNLNMIKFKYLPVTKLSIDRDGIPVNNYTPYLEELTLGEHVTEVLITPDALGSLSYIRCLGLVPPSIRKQVFSIDDVDLLPSEFTNAQYMNMIVEVPAEALEAYQTSEVWKNFWNLKAYDPSSVGEVVSPDTVTEIGRYDLNGRKVSDKYTGIVIVRYSDGSTRKMILRN